jgi:hypothetical protein
MRTLVFTSLLSVTSMYAADATPTYSRDVAPIIQRNCQGCHRTGEAAPMPLTSYKDTRPFAAAIKEAVSLKKMPPWFADPHYGQFANDRSLSQHDVETLAAWVKAGAPEGDAKETPRSPEYLDGWNIPKPDVVLEMPAAFSVPATGTIDYQYVLVPGKFEKDTWVQMAEVRPGNRAVLHHVIAYIRPAGSKWLPGIKAGVPFVPDGEGAKGHREFLVGYAPGMPPAVLSDGRAKLIPAGSDIIFEMHYTTNGKAGTDQTKIGLTFPKGEVRERVMTLAAANDEFEIPARAGSHRVDADFEFGTDAKIISLMPHMHLRGKDFVFEATYPTGEKQTLLNVPHYSFSWQLVYYPAADLVMPKGTKIHCVAHFDNSANNPFNPDPSKLIKFGEQSWDEMMIGFFDVAFDKNMDPKSLYPPDPPKEEKAANVLPTVKNK